MADRVEKTIYKLELDDSGYIKGVNSLTASTDKFTASQAAANKRLQDNEKALQTLADVVEKDRKALENYGGTDQKFRKQLEDSLKTSQTQYAKTAELVATIRKKYEEASKAAQDFANTTEKANGLQAQTGGKLPGPGITPTIIPPVIPPIAFEDFDLKEILGANTIEFEKLRAAIETAEKALAALDQESEEFKQLAPIVAKGREALKQYDDAAKLSSGSTQSLRSQLRQAREELVRMEQAGQGTSKAYFDLEKRTAKLTDEFNDQQQRIRILASDTKLLDFGKGAITATTSAFQIYASVSILVGDQSEELQKKTMQLFAAMQLLQALEQLSNLTRREGVLATLAQSAAQSAYTAVVGTSTGALRVFRLALAATGIGAAIAGIVALVLYFQRAAKAAAELKREEKLLSDIQKEVAKSAGSEIATLQRLYSVATNTTISIKERKKAVDELQKQYPEHFKNIKDEIILQGKAGAAYDATKTAILEAAKARAIESKLSELATKELEKEQEKQDLLRAQEKNRLAKQKADRKDSRDAETRGLEQFNVIAKSAEIAKSLGEVNKDLENISKDRDFLLSKIISAGIDPTTKIDTKKTENVFKEKLKELQAKLAEETTKSFETEGNIRKQFKASLEKEIQAIKELLKDKKLTSPQSKILIDLTARINEVQLNEALKQFNKKVTDARKKLNDDINDLQSKNQQDQINLLQDEFEKRRQLIDFNEKQEIQNSKEATQGRLDALNLDRLLIGEKAYQEAKADIISAGEQQALIIQRKAAQERQKLAADLFQNLLSAYDAAIFESDLVRDKQLLKDLQAQLRLFQAGKISFEQFQKSITKIQKEAQAERTTADLNTEKAKLAALDRELLAIQDKYSDHYKKLKKQRDDLEADITKKETEGVTSTEDPNTKRITKVVEYVDAIGKLADSVIAFWQKANEAESQALDRSISLQEKRVDAAQKIAERGNAQYLKQEQDRLTELNIQRENAARKQLGIDAALQASQLLVGITGAIAKIASGIGAAETIAEIAIIVGALATGYGLVKSLQGNQPKLKKGDPYVRRGNNPAGVDTIPAWLNEGEAVTSAEKNKQYHPVIRAIHDGTVPAEHLNNFVKTYHKVKSVPQVDYGRIKDVAELNIGHDGRMASILSEHSSLLRENNELQRQILGKKILVEQKVDRDGVAMMVTEYIEKQRIASKT